MQSNPLRKVLYIVNEDFAFLLNRLPMARAARDAGYEVHVATNVNNGAAAIEAEGFILHRIPFRRGGLSPIAAIPTLLAIRKVEKEVQPSVVHHSGLQCCVYGSAAALDQKFRMVNAITGLGYIFTSVNWRTRLLRGGMMWLLPWLLNRRHSHVLVQNPDDREALLSLGIRPGRMTLIPGSGVDTDALQPLAEPSGPITLGFAGRLLVDKGIRALVAAHQILREEGRDYNLVIAGNPDPPNPTSVSLDEVANWAARPGITWLGHIDDITSLWRSCHIAVLPSHREGLPVSLMEAAACSRPLIATDAPGCREIVHDRQTGLLVPIENPVGLARAIKQLAESQELRARYGEAARQLVIDKLSAKLIGKSIVELYDGLVGEPVIAHIDEVQSLPEKGKIVLVSQHYAPYPSTTSGYMTEISEHLAKESRVLVITSAPGSGSNPVAPGKPEVIEIKSWWPGKSALVSRSLAAMLFSVQVFFSLLKHAQKEDVLLSVTTPFTLPHTMALAARLRRAASAVIIYDLYPDTLVMSGILGANSILTRLLRSANGIMFSWLDAVVVIGRDMTSKLLTYPKVTSSSINLIPNWATMPIGYRAAGSDNPFRQRCNRRFVVAMSGNAGYTHDPMSVLEAARLLKDHDDVGFLLSGEGVGWTKIKAMQAEAPVSNVTLVERVSDADLEDFLSAGDVWIVPYRKNNTGVSVPSRIYNLFAVGRPIIICSEPEAEAALLLKEEAIGWVIPPEDPKALADAILAAAAHAAETADMGRHASQVAARYTPSVSLSEYRQLMDRLLMRQHERSRERVRQVA